MFKLFSKITLLKIIGSTAIVFSAIFFLPNFVFAASGGPNNPGTAVDDSSVGSITWSNPTRVVSSNNSYATASLNDNQISHYIKATNFGFAIPAGAVINGITVEVEKKSANASRIQDYRVRIVKGGVIGSTDESNPNWWGTTDAYTTYGSSTELWGQTWTVADINSANFGLAFSAYKNTTQGNAVTASVDHVRITVTYTPNTAPNAPTLVSPANGSYTNNNKPTLSANYSDPDAGTTGTTNYRIAISAINCTGGTVVSSGTSATTASNNQNTTWTPATSIGVDATYYWCAQNNDGFFTSAWTSMGNFILDTVAPTNTISTPSASITNTGPITYTISYTGADLVVLSNGNVTLNGTGTATGTIAVTGTGTSTRTVTISSISGDGTLGISIAGATASDIAGNSSLPAGPSATFSVSNSVSTTQSTVSASPATLVADGLASSTVNVTLLNINSNPVSGKTVTLAKTSGPGTPTITTLSGTTNASGIATFAVSSVTVGTNTFTATDVTDALVVVQTVNITFSTDVVSSANSSVVASPTSVLANGTSTSMITVILEDNHNNPVSGKLISLAVTSGPGSAIITPVMDITDASGTAQFTVSSDVPGTYIFTATDVTDSLVISQTASVIFFITSIPAPRSIPLSITISGRAYPGAQVSLYEKTPSSDNFVASSIASSASGDFTIRKSGIPPGQYDYFLQAKDKNNNLSQVISYSADLSTNRLAVNTVLVSPTLSLTRSYLTRGDFITAIGYAAQNSTITLFIDNNKPFNVDADNTGNYKLLINTAEFDYGTHSIKAKQYDPSIGLQSDLSPIINFTLVKSLVPGTDYNGDGKVDIQDFSSFLSLWQNKDMLADLNHDGKVDIQDWSIFLKSVTIK